MITGSMRKGDEVNEVEISEVTVRWRGDKNDLEPATQARFLRHT